MRGLRRAVHDLRAGSTARVNGGEVRESARTLRPHEARTLGLHGAQEASRRPGAYRQIAVLDPAPARDQRRERGRGRSEEHTSELQSLMRISYAVFCLKKKNK